METKKPNNHNKCIALSGGVGGAKLALGLEKIISSEDLIVVLYFGEDLMHFVLYFSP